MGPCSAGNESRLCGRVVREKLEISSIGQFRRLWLVYHAEQVFFAPQKARQDVSLELLLGDGKKLNRVQLKKLTPKTV